MKTNKISSGYYKGEYRGFLFEIVKVEGINQWYWLCSDGEGGQDWYSCKKFAISGVKEYIDEKTNNLKS